MFLDAKPAGATLAGQADTKRYTTILILVTLALYLACFWFPEIMTLAGVTHHGVWFMDTYAILAALDALRLGLDPYVYNPLNHFGGPHVYSHWWFWLEKTGLSRADSIWLGATVSGLAMVNAWWILRPRSRRELAFALVVMCSAPVVLGLNRGNVDLLLFVLLSPCLPCLLARSRFWRITGAPGLIALATGLKFYPVACGLVLLAVRPLRDRTLALAFMAALFIPVGLSIAPDLASYRADRLPEGLYTFGARIALKHAGLADMGAALVAVGFLTLVGVWFVQRANLGSIAVPDRLKKEYLLFILGAAILTGSFILTINYAYRWVYAIWMLPFLCRLEVPAASVFLHQWLAATRRLLIIVLASETAITLVLNGGLAPNSQSTMDDLGDLTNALIQPMTWLLFACLSGWLAHFIVIQLKGLPLQSAEGN